MYRIEVERADGSTFFYGRAKFEGGRRFSSLDGVNAMCEELWARVSFGNRVARLSVVDSDGNRLTDWEV